MNGKIEGSWGSIKAASILRKSPHVLAKTSRHVLKFVLRALLKTIDSLLKVGFMSKAMMVEFLVSLHTLKRGLIVHKLLLSSRIKNYIIWI